MNTSMLAVLVTQTRQMTRVVLAGPVTVLGPLLVAAGLDDGRAAERLLELPGSRPAAA